MPSISKCKVAFLDLDGTLLDSNLEISRISSKAVVDAASSGVRIVFASGRPLASIARLTRSFASPEMYAIGSNGGCTAIFPDLRILQSRGFEPEIPQRLIHIADQSDIALCLYTTHGWFTSRHDEYVALEQTRSSTQSTGLIDSMNPNSEVIKAMLVGPNDRLTSLKERISAEFTSGLEAFFTYPEYLELMPDGVSKVTACDHLLDSLGLTWADAMVVGDGLNDMTMMTKASTRVAMNNAHPLLIQVANVMAPSNDESGAAHALRAFALGESDAVLLMKPIEHKS